MAWWRIALPASIILNLFLIALIGGHVLSRQRPELVAGSPLARAFASAEATLSPPDAAALGASIRHDAPGYLDAARQLAVARAELGHVIEADPYDPAQVRQALKVWQAAWNHFVDDFSNPLVGALGQVSPAGRRKLVQERRPGPALDPISQ
jgi:uncharacterized membrane protein